MKPRNSTSNRTWINPALLLFMISVVSMFPAIQACAAQSEWDPQLARGTLDNGLTYILYDSGKAEDPFNIRLVVHAGSVDEDVPSGVAHGLEHMVFQSTAGHPETLHRYIQDIGWRTGVQINAVTREAETQYMIRTRPGDALELEGALALMADIAFGARLQEHEWERERGVILEELRQSEGVPDRINRQKKALLRAGSRYVDRPTIGTREGIENITVADLRTFHERYYVASNMTLIVSGRLDKEKAEAAIRENFSHAAAKPRPMRPYVVLPLKEGLTVGTVQDSKGTTSQVTYAFRMPMPDRASKAGQLAYLQKYLLNRLIRDTFTRQATHYAPVVENFSSVMQETTENRLILAFSTRTHDHEAAWPLLLEAVERLRREGLSRERYKAELAVARRVNENNVEGARSRTFAQWEDRIASAVLMNTVLEAPDARTTRTRALLDELSFETLNATLLNMLAAPDRVLFYQLPGTAEHISPDAARIEAEHLRLAGLENLPELLPASPTEEETASPPAWPAEAVLPSGGALVSERRTDEPSIHEWNLLNGDRIIWLVRDTPDGKVYLSGQSARGYDNAEFGSVVSQAALQLWTQSGFRFWSQEQYDRWRKAQPADWSWALKDSRLDVAAAVAPALLPDLLRRYAATVQFGTVRDEAATEFLAQLASPSVTDASEYARLLYGEAVGTPRAGYDRGARQLIVAAEALLAEPVTWFAVGPAPEAETLDVLMKIVGTVPRASALTPKPLLQRPGFRREVVETLADNRASVRLSFFSAMSWTPEAAFLMSSLTPLAQQALKNELRHALGGIYSLSFELTLDPDTHRAVGTLSFHCAPERADELANAALDVLAAMPAFVEKADIRRIREDIDFAESIRGTDVNTQLRRLALSYARYGDGGYLRRVGQLASQLSIALLEDYARLIFGMENTAILIEKPKKIVTP